MNNPHKDFIENNITSGYLSDDSESKNNLIDLLNLIKNIENNKFVPFIGSGPSKPTGIGLIKDIIIDICHNYNINIESVIRKFYNNNNIEKIIKEIESFFKENRIKHTEIFPIITDKFPTKDCLLIDYFLKENIDKYPNLFDIIYEKY